VGDEAERFKLTVASSRVTRLGRRRLYGRRSCLHHPKSNPATGVLPLGDSSAPSNSASTNRGCLVPDYVQGHDAIEFEATRLI
jgi:hypothetical protein